MSGRVVVADMPSPLQVSRSVVLISRGEMFTASATSITVDHSETKLHRANLEFEFIETHGKFAACRAQLFCYLKKRNLVSGAAPAEFCESRLFRPSP